MQPATKKLYKLINDIKTENEFEKELQQKSKFYDDLFDEKTLALLIIDELGRNKQAITPIRDMQPNNEYTIIGTITTLSDARTFHRKNGKEGKVINLDIRDTTGSCRLVLWNEDIQQVENKKIKLGSQVKIMNGYTKQGRFGLEIHLNRWSLLEIHNESIQNTNKNMEYTAECNSNIIHGILIKKEPTRPFFKENGEFGFVTTISIKEKNIYEKKLILWDTKVKDIQNYSLGDILTIQGIQQKDNNGVIEYHVNGKSTIIKN